MCIGRLKGQAGDHCLHCGGTLGNGGALARGTLPKPPRLGCAEEGKTLTLPILLFLPATRVQGYLASPGSSVKVSNASYKHTCVHSVAKLCLTLCDPVDCSPPGISHMGFPRQEHWSGFPFLPPGDLPDPGIKSTSPAMAGGFITTEPPGQT